MPATEIYAKQRQRTDTAANWATNNPVLLLGEIGIESDTRKFKFGNGTSLWNALQYAGGSTSGGSLAVDTLTFVTGSLASGTSQNFVINGGDTFQLLSFTASNKAWIRLYGTSAARSADTRTSPGGTVPLSGAEFYAELVTTVAAQTIRLSPVPTVQATAGDVFVRVQNMSSTTETLTLTFLVLVLVASA